MAVNGVAILLMGTLSSRSSQGRRLWIDAGQALQIDTPTSFNNCLLRRAKPPPLANGTVNVPRGPGPLSSLRMLPVRLGVA